jgi:hypothetical protein
VDKNTLEQLMSTLNWWMGVATLAVLVGILGEYIAHFAFGEKSKRSLREIAVTILCGVLVLGGVGGEFWCGRRLSQVSDQLQRISDQEVANANERAKGFEAQIAAANGIAADANQLAGSEKSAREGLENKIRSRHLTADQQSKITAALADVPSPISIYSQALDGESGDYADDFTLALKAAKWQTFGPNRSRMTSEQGVEIGTLAPGTPATAVMLDRIQRAFAAAGFETNVVYLIVDHKKDAVPPRRQN